MNDEYTHIGYGAARPDAPPRTEGGTALDPSDPRWIAAVSGLDAEEATPVVRWLGSRPMARAVESLAERFPTGGDLALEHLLTGEASVSAIKQARRRTRDQLAEATDGEAHAATLFAHLFLTAVALRFHHVRLGGRPEEALEPLLLEVATAVEEPYESIFAEAALVRGAARG